MVVLQRIGTGGYEDHEALLGLILRSFSYMDGVIDPPSSAHRLTVESLKQKARDEIGHVALDGGVPVGCIYLRPEADCLYVGKLAVEPGTQGRGIGRRLMNQAEALAAELSLPALRLETRIELVGNHNRFGAWGFVKTAEKAHPGYDRMTFIEMRKPLL
ncbi:GNAT family N-acetyltransferase [Rhizobium wuzhouense]|uniref:GNAT family N-acetyltransferase n=1 Tax=Rhizobium wuzhouense TaxID=1986026 RepID=A0ABX5NMD5_9HYPH|nr:GNAT family N-acetyltransferase [Rhizobium wuzhouense]PYB70041.1 GNAT family N-acetyltransferase [Rhizobium wuzhouense]